MAPLSPKKNVLELEAYFDNSDRLKEALEKKGFAVGRKHNPKNWTAQCKCLLKTCKAKVKASSAPMHKRRLMLDETDETQLVVTELVDHSVTCLESPHYH